MYATKRPEIVFEIFPHIEANTRVIIFHAFDIMGEACRDKHKNSLHFLLEVPWNEVLTDAAKQSTFSINQSRIMLIIKVTFVKFLITRHILFMLSPIFDLFPYYSCKQWFNLLTFVNNLDIYCQHNREDTSICQLSATVSSFWNISHFFSVDKILYILFPSCKDFKFLYAFSLVAKRFR